jgi:aminoglycoside phosphotransferase (APT) family kinase protein
MIRSLAAFAARRWAVPPDLLQVTLEPLGGGLESTVVRAHLAIDGGSRGMPSRLVIKALPPGGEREAFVYETLWRHVPDPPAVRVLGRQPTAQGTHLYLEDAQPAALWPWSDTAVAADVCRVLARLHDAAPPARAFAWDYESELSRSAAATLELAARVREPDGRRCWRRLGDLRRVVAALPRLRGHLGRGPLTAIHGDMHPGNVIIRPAGRATAVLLIDWARARIGSPFEDIASWLHSLGCWEPQARRRHDWLMRTYLESRRRVRPFDAAARRDYWFASASNGLAGAIRYHLAVAGDEAVAAPARRQSRQALAAWTRVVRRAAALVSTSADR